MHNKVFEALSHKSLQVVQAPEGEHQLQPVTAVCKVLYLSQQSVRGVEEEREKKKKKKGVRKRCQNVNGKPGSRDPQSQLQ